MRIDLHCHTKKTKEGEPLSRNVTPDVFKQKIIDANVEIVAITNHNCFDIEQFSEFKEIAADSFQLWPGVEFDVNLRTDKRIHLIIISNPLNTNEFYSTISKILQDSSPDEFSISLDEIISTFASSDVIYIPHFEKEPGLSMDEAIEFQEHFADNWRLFFEAQNARSMGVYINHDYASIVGSDVRDWTQYEMSSFSELRLPVESFKQFCMLAQRDPEMHQVKKGNEWHFGERFHVGVDAGTGYVHSIAVTAANKDERAVVPDLIRPDDRVMYGNAGYSGLPKRKEIREDAHLSSIDYRTNTRNRLHWKTQAPGFDWDRYIEYQKSRVRSKVDYIFLILKRLFHYRKVRYRGLGKNRTHAFILMACANLFMLAQSGWRMGDCDA